ncbi:probable BOI-related E3 ubiquitin-protein ligase 2 [Spinacia oleracea]|uniref:Probable BOI-related E3 ubiquitin-protein ligase 2 n=1 Tax=Spinacia oleracea TaxID=3562 RepID=A0A9R0JYP4_SPIOL|nr:probable BOI-related E3 ubiquitin-protein ligase 2 [Spinacia oleracea]
MAIQAQMYPDNFGLPLIGGGVTGGGGGGGCQQDWVFLAANNQINTNSNNFVNGCGFNEISTINLQQQKQQQQYQYQQQQQQQQQQSLLQLQQQYLLQIQNHQQQQQQRSSFVNHNNISNNNNDGFVFLSSPKNCTTVSTTTTTASTTTSGGSCDYQIPPMSFSPSFSNQLEKQRQEIDRFITLQNERLKMALQEQRKQQLATLMRELKAKATQIMHQKDEEIARAAKRTMDLEEIIQRMEIENQEWQRLATENEAMVHSLNNTLVQLKEQQNQQQGSISSSCSSNEVDDAESCCNNFVANSKKRGREGETGVETGVVAETRVKRGKTGEVLCKVCKSGKSCVLLLPCRHLCCCKGCEALVDACPVCKSAKMASIEALIS